MKRYLLAISAVVCTVVMVSFTTASESKDKFVCQWFFYDDPAITTPSLDYPSSASDALTQANYRFATQSELDNICNVNLKLCAICAEVDPANPTKPLLTVGQPIVTHINAYFAVAEPSRNPNTSFIKEKFQQP